MWLYWLDRGCIPMPAPVLPCDSQVSAGSGTEQGSAPGGHQPHTGRLASYTYSRFAVSVFDIWPSFFSLGCHMHPLVCLPEVWLWRFQDIFLECLISGAFGIFQLTRISMHKKVSHNRSVSLPVNHVSDSVPIHRHSTHGHLAPPTLLPKTESVLSASSGLATPVPTGKVLQLSAVIKSDITNLVCCIKELILIRVDTRVSDRLATRGPCTTPFVFSHSAVSPTNTLDVSDIWWPVSQALKCRLLPM